MLKNMNDIELEKKMKKKKFEFLPFSLLSKGEYRAVGAQGPFPLQIRRQKSLQRKKRRQRQQVITLSCKAL